MPDSRIKLLEQIEENRFLPITDQVFQTYNAYEALCREENDENALLALYFYKGEALFRLGRYEEALALMNQFLLERRQDTPLSLSMNSLNILGLIYAAMGQDYLALDHYLQAYEIATQQKDYSKRIIIQINLVWLYRDLNDYEKALACCEKCITDLPYEHHRNVYNLEIPVYSYLGQIYFCMERYQDGMNAYEHILDLQSETEHSFYDITLEHLRIRVFAYLNDMENLSQSVRYVIDDARMQADFLEFSETYIEICRFLIDIDQALSRELLDTIHLQAAAMQVPYLSLKVQTLEVLYQEKYADATTYLQTCSNFTKMQLRYNVVLKKSILLSMQNVETLRLVKMESERYLDASKRDAMTGLFNKVYFESNVQNQLSSMQLPVTAPYALAVVDIDNFKQVNDTYGHLQGDKIIKSLTTLLKNAFSESAIIGRIGGDEFAVFWSVISSREDLISSLETLLTQCELSGNTISIGTVFSTVSHPSYHDLFKTADQALYRAKNNGRNTLASAVLEDD